MDVGREFSSWESFIHTLEQYSKEQKVAYVVGTCKSVETANKHEALKNKFPVRFKYCFARMLCKHESNYSVHSNRLRSHHRTCKTGCTSSVLISVNKKRTALVIKEANLQHTHEISEKSFSRYTQNLRLQGEERRMASVLLRSGVPLSQVQEFISSACSKDRDVQNLKGSIKGTLSEKEGHEYAFLSDLDQLMAEDPESVVEMINFSLVPRAIYIQTSEMTRRMNSLSDGRLQIVTHDINDGKISVISIIALDSNLTPHILALCITICDTESVFQYFLEAFVRENSEFCDSLTGVVLDCSKDNADFLQQLIPQVSVAWSRSYVLNKLTEVKNGTKDVQKIIQLRKELMNSNSEEAYEKKLKDLFDSCSAFRELWTQYEISSHAELQHQEASVEVDFVNFLKTYVKPSMSLSEVIKALLKLCQNKEPETADRDKSFVSNDPSCEHYQQLCFPEAAQAVICQLSIALSSCYEIKTQTDMIFVKKLDTGDEFMLDTLGSKCTCQYFLDTDLPCQHIFAWLHSTGKSLYSELLIPAKCQVFGRAITLDALAESLAQGYVPSSRLHDERLKELQIVLKDTLSSCCSHSYEQMGKDLILLKQVYNIMKNNCAHNATLLINAEKKESLHEAPTETTASATPAPKKRGRPSKKPKLQQEMNLQPPDKRSSVSIEKTQITPPVMRHNLRTNIKHKFVTRELRTTNEQISDTPNSAIQQKTVSGAGKAVPANKMELSHSTSKYTNSVSSPEVSEDEVLTDNTMNTLSVKNKIKQISKEYIDVIKEHLRKFCREYHEHAYQVAACIICQAFLTHVPIADMLQAVRAWPSHLPELPTSRTLEAEVSLAVGQTLTICGHKLNQLDMDTLKPDREISPK
ncbi:unnamed protein product, partial [Candidula unifasciata]